MDYNLKLQKINKDAFSPYGIYLDGPAGTPAHSEDSFDWWNELSLLDFGGKASLGVVRAKYTGGFCQNIFERHKHSIEALVPLNNDIIVIVGGNGALNDGVCKPDDFAAFWIPRHTMVAFDAGILHRAPMTLADSADVLVLFKEFTSTSDTEIIELNDINFRVML
jgi:ureidoglycolate hydrolase